MTLTGVLITSHLLLQLTVLLKMSLHINRRRMRDTQTFKSREQQSIFTGSLQDDDTGEILWMKLMMMMSSDEVAGADAYGRPEAENNTILVLQGTCVICKSILLPTTDLSISMTSIGLLPNCGHHCVEHFLLIGGGVMWSLECLANIAGSLSLKYKALGWLLFWTAAL